MSFSPVEEMYKSFESDKGELTNLSLLSITSTYESQFSKYLILVSASNFEERVTQILDEILGKSDLQSSFLRNFSIKRKYHALFSWEQSGKRYNAKSFFKLFGEDFLEHVTKYIKENSLEDPIHSFIEIGNLRNRMVHQNICAFTIDLTTKEIFNKSSEANRFVESLNNIFTTYKIPANQ